MPHIYIYSEFDFVKIKEHKIIVWIAELKITTVVPTKSNRDLIHCLQLLSKNKHVRFTWANANR